MKSKYLLKSLLIVTSLISCKKSVTAPNPNALITGKWQINKHNSALFKNGAEVSSNTKTNFTNDDFVQYFNDGSGYYSIRVAGSPSLNEFKYDLTGKFLTIYYIGDKTGIAETVTNLTAISLSVHAESLIIDPNNSNSTDNETDDYFFTRAN